MAPFDPGGVTLTDEETQAALSQARALKAVDAEKDYRAQWQRNVWQEMGRPWAPKDMADYVRRRFAQTESRELVVDDANRALMNTLCFYFTGSAQFEREAEGRSLEKGLLISGDVGVGKTTIMRAFGSNKRQPFELISCRKLAGMFAADGHGMLQTYAGFKHELGTGFWHFGHRRIGYCFDDLGTEREKKHYGNGVNVMGELLLNCYDRREVPFYARHITTNLTADDIEDQYGIRVRDRLREMFNVIELRGESRRR